MNGNQAILDRTATDDDRAGTTQSMRPQSSRGPWLQLGTIQQFEWNRYELPVASLPAALDRLRILHLSDVHLKSVWHPALDALLERVQRDVPDLIFVTGDFVEDKFDARRAERLVERFVTGLRSRFGIFAIVGNHDGDFIAPRAARWGATVLPIGSHPVTVRGAPIELIALAGVDRKDLTAQDVLNLHPRNRSANPRDSGATPCISRASCIPRIVLSHYPDALAQLTKHDVSPDLHFAGHTHGGQVCLPGGIPIIKHDTLPRRHCSGVHRFGDSWLVVSRGMGFSSYPIRIFCPAEVVEVVIKSKDEG